jgi:hypothetical protein
MQYRNSRWNCFFTIASTQESIIEEAFVMPSMRNHFTYTPSRKAIAKNLTSLMKTRSRSK